MPTTAYNDTAHKHGVTHLVGVQKYWYDANGNAERRVNFGLDVNYTYDAENRSLRTDGSKVNFDDIEVSQFKKYYYAGGQRLAMRDANNLFMLFGDHLGSTSLTVDAGGVKTGEMLYKPWGETRYSNGATPTSYRYTGQREDATIGLYFYNARYYDPALGRFTQPDTIVPEPGNPQSLNRYAYVLNNPLKYIDPSGFDPIDAAWEAAFQAEHGCAPTDQDRRDRLFSILFPGSGANGDWTDADWAKYDALRDSFWSGAKLWQGAAAPGLDRFVGHLTRLAGYYSAGEENLYAQAVGFIWGGVPLGHAIPAAWQMATNPGAAWTQFTPLFEGTGNWDPRLVDDENPSHHYAGLFYMGFFFGPAIGHASNWLRDGPLSGTVVEDLNLGYLAVNQGAMLYDGIICMAEVGLAVLYAVDARPGLWPGDTPGARVPWYYPQPWAR